MISKDARYVISIAKYNSISKAAESLFVSQSTLSHALNRIEHDLGISLFNRSKSPLEITEAGKVYIHAAQQMILIDNNMRKELDDIQDDTRGSLNLGLTSLAQRCYFTRVFPNIYKKYPNYKIHLKMGSVAQLQELIDSDIIDAAIMVGIESNRYDYIPLLNYSIVLVAPKTFQLNCQDNRLFTESRSSFPNVNFSALAKREFLLMTPGQQLFDIANNLFAHYHFTPNVILECSDMNTIHDLVSKGIGVSLLPDIIIPFVDSSNVKYYQIANESLNRTLYLTFKKGKYLPKLIKEFKPINRNQFF